jgi:lysophospholipase L1-like esterase
MLFIGRSRAVLGAAAVLLGGLVGAVFAATSVAQSTAIVAMGDSEISGEGAGSYEAATDGPSNYCHRSLKAWIKVVAIKADVHVNLACSGADSSNLTSGQLGQYGEPSQADRLASVAKLYRVKYIFVTVGANDDPDFGGTATRCVYAYVFQTGYGCAQTDGPTWANRVANMEPKVQGALSSIEAVMSTVHYPYHLIVVSYGGPAPEPPARYADGQYWSKLWHGCPIYDADAKWGHDTAAPVLDAGERTVAANANLRFLDMVEGFDGHEVCAKGITASQEWVRGVTYDPNGSDWWTAHAVQQSLHPNALGHSKIAGCVADFVAQAYREGACRIGSDGNLHSQPHP